MWQLRVAPALEVERQPLDHTATLKHHAALLPEWTALARAEDDAASHFLEQTRLLRCHRLRHGPSLVAGRRPAIGGAADFGFGFAAMASRPRSPRFLAMAETVPEEVPLAERRLSARQAPLVCSECGERGFHSEVGVRVYRSWRSSGSRVGRPRGCCHLPALQLCVPLRSPETYPGVNRETMIGQRDHRVEV